MQPSITVEVVFCTKNQQFLKKLHLPQSLSIREVIKLSEIQKQFMEIDFTSNLLNVGVFSKIKPLDYQVKDGDRVEIYRPLHQSPMQARLARARKK
jgi:putative ubiquitin-RnfH superfamily antitoxin RatB of RatAB toxin-antitoxin module